MSTTTSNGSITRKDLDDLLSSTILTREVDFSGTTPAGWSGGAGGGTPGRTVEATIRQVLGYRPRAGDTNGFVAALNAVFVSRDAGGFTEFTYTPRSYSAEVQADFGALTGAQASLFARAKAGLDQALPLLEGLYPLRADADTEDCDAVRATVRLKLTELIDEIGVLGGPRPARVDNYFAVLVGAGDYDSSATAPPILTQLGKRPAAILKDMQRTFGLEDSRVNNITEEQNLTNFLILVDTVVTLRANWVSIRDSFRRTSKTSGVFFGTQLVLLSQQLAVVVEAVQETVFAMESVFLGSAERQTVVLDFSGLLAPVPGNLVSGPPPLDPITIGELFDWVSGLAADEIPQAIEQSGKEGVIALFSTLELVDRYVRATRQLSAQPSTNPTPKFHHGRVTSSLANLQSVMCEAVKLAEQITRNGPHAVAATFDHNAVTITGSGFEAPATARFDLTQQGKPASVVSVPGLPTDHKTISVTEQGVVGGLTKGASSTVVVINPDLQRSDPVTVGAPPIVGVLVKPTVVIERIDGASSKIGQPTTIRVTGGAIDQLTKIELYDLGNSAHVFYTVPSAGGGSFPYTPQDPAGKIQLPQFLGMRFVGDPAHVAEVTVNTTQPAVFHVTR